MIVKCVITTLDNLSLLKEQIPILREESIDEIIVVNNGSIDGTKEWLATQLDLTVVNRENCGAGPGRNSGLDSAGKFDYVLMLDGGIRPLRGGTQAMLDYLHAHPECDVIAPEVATCFTTDIEKAHRRMQAIDENTCFAQCCLSGTAYALCRKKAWDGFRFSEEGPFGKATWGCDDNQMQFEWNRLGIIHHDFSGIQVYRHASGSFARLFKETGIWPNQYGSGYEQRNVLLTHMYPEYYDPVWHKTNIQVSCVILGWNEFPMFARAIKVLHDDLKDIPHEVIFVDNGSTDGTKSWLDTFALRWQWGDTVINADDEIIRRGENPDLEPIWTGNVIRVDLPENMGTGAGYNAGFEKARGKYIFFLSGDILPVMGSISGMFEYMETHEDCDYLSINPWCCQSETEDVEFEGFDHLPRQGLGNYAGSYAIFRREVIDEGCRLADSGPFAGPGCGFEEAEFANQMYAKDFRCYTFNHPAYYHKRREFRRSGHEEEEKQRRLQERRQWIWTKWRGSDFNIRHYHIQPPERHVRNVAVVYKAASDRPGIGGSLLAALQDICHADYFQPGYEQPGYDNYLYTDNGDFDYFPCPEFAHPSIFWAIDMMTPQQDWRPQLRQYVKRARTFDAVYAAQPSAVTYFDENGIQAEWLPLAANPDYHRPYDVEKYEFDWIALWHNCGERIEYVEFAKSRFPQGHVGWSDGENYARDMSKARCALNLSRSNELTLRVFEAMAIGVPLVCDRVRGLDSLFKEDIHYRGFDNKLEMVDQIEWVLRNPEEAQAMVVRARSEVLARHTYYHRILTMFGKQE